MKVLKQITMHNLISYFIYAIVVSTLILRVGHVCYKNGKIYMSRLLPEDLELSNRINNILLAGYYLLNLGYGIYGISNWQSVRSLAEIAETVSTHLATITLILAAIHFLNMITIHLIYKSSSKL